MQARPWTYQDFVKDALTRIPEVSCEELLHRFREPEAVVLDCREPDETADGTLPGAVVLPRGLVEKHVREHILSTDSPVYVICSSGNRSAMVADAMAKMGYGRVANVKGGVERWRHLGYPFQGAPAALVKSPSPNSCAIPTAATATTRARAGVPRAARSAVSTPPTTTCSASPSGRIHVGSMSGAPEV